jgi:hypothetical protein
VTSHKPTGEGERELKITTMSKLGVLLKENAFVTVLRYGLSVPGDGQPLLLEGEAGVADRDR